LMGGVLSKVSHAFPFWVAGGLAAVNTISAYFFLPETHHERITDTPLSFNPLKPLRNAIEDVKLRPYYITWFLFAMSFVTGQAVFALFVAEVFGMSAFATGMFFAIMGVCSSINQAFVLKKILLPKFSSSSLELAALAAGAFGLLIMSFSLLPLFIAGIVFVSFGQSTLRVVITSQVAGHADKSKKGETIGILGALMSSAMVISPMIAGALFELHARIPYLVAAGYMIVAFLIAYPLRNEGVRFKGEKVEGVLEG